MEKLELYALYKQATYGDASGDRPGMMDFFGRTKFDAWTELKGWTKERAMEEYVSKTAHLEGVVEGKEKKEERKIWPNHQPDLGIMMPDDTFKGKVALVTGGGAGLGRGWRPCLVG